MADEWLWESTMQAFNRQFADVLEQEKAKALLRRGFKMEGGDLDAYISKFEQTVRHAGLNLDCHARYVSALTYGCDGLGKQ